MKKKVLLNLEKDYSIFDALVVSSQEAVLIVILAYFFDKLYIIIHIDVAIDETKIRQENSKNTYKIIKIKKYLTFTE